MRVLVVTSGTPFVQEGAEILAGSLTDALAAAGHAAELVSIPFSDDPPNRIPSQILACRLLDLTESSGARIDRIIGLNFPAYLVPHPNKVIWLLRQRRTPYELLDHPEGPIIRETIRRVDRELIPEAKAVYAVSKNVARRLNRSCGIMARTLYHPPAHAGVFHPGRAADYFFFPGPISSGKRQLLAIQAMVRCRERTIVRFAGEADTDAIRQLKLEGRVEWLGRLSEEQKRELYAHCLGVLFPAEDEDCGSVALEAMLASKPVITCADSGGPLEFVQDHQTGLVVQPVADSLAQAMDNLWADRRCAEAMGEAGRARYAELDISWDRVVENLLR